MASYPVQQFFADYYKTLILQKSFPASDPCYLNASSPRFVDPRTWQFQQLVNKLKNSNVQEYDLASVNGVILENNYLKYCLQKAQTMKICVVSDTHIDGTLNQSQIISALPAINNTTFSEDEEVDFREEEIPSGFLSDFLYLMEATKHLPIKTQNIVVLHFALEFREQMNQQNMSR